MQSLLVSQWADRVYQVCGVFDLATRVWYVAQCVLVFVFV